MFERYTEKARRVIFFARYEASHHGSPQIEAEHLLLGLVHEERSLCGQWLPNAQPDSIRQKIERSFETRPATPTSVDLPLSLTGKAVLAHAQDEADRMNSRHIGTEHLLLGLIREDSLAARILFDNGADSTNYAPVSNCRCQAAPKRGWMPSQYKSVDYGGTRLTFAMG